MSVFAPARPGAGVATAPEERADPFEVLAADLPRGKAGRLAQSVPSAFEALRANKGRAVLTALGIIIGVAAVIVMVPAATSPSTTLISRLWAVWFASRQAVRAAEVPRTRGALRRATSFRPEAAGPASGWRRGGSASSMACLTATLV